MEVLAKAPESSTQTLPTPVASWWWQQVPFPRKWASSLLLNFRDLNSNISPKDLENCAWEASVEGTTMPLDKASGVQHCPCSRSHLC